ncbi:MAG: hypothetical protein J6K75_04190 [Erysipelotrichaceae bacterium]|nr:hypothetical protein [Erysipelotrichaceae bacterium]
MKKVISLINGIVGILCGIAIIILAIVDIETPKLLWLVFALFNFINAVLILRYSNLWNKSKK